MPSKLLTVVRIALLVAAGVQTLSSLTPVAAGTARAAAPADTPAAQEAGPNPLEDLLRAGLAGAVALRDEVQGRIDQATRGQGGIDARAEDIAAARAQLAADRAALRLQQPFPDVRFYQGSVSLWDGLVRSSQKLRDSCGDLRLTTVIKYHGEEMDRKLRSDLNCPSHQKDALDAGVDLARAQEASAEIELARRKTPAPTIANLYAPFEQQIVKDEQQIQKLQSGGSFDRSALDLYLALAQADVNTMLAVAQGATAGTLQQQLQAAQAELAEAEHRRQQAASGQGGVGVRPEDIAQAAADVKSAEAELGLLLHPLTEQVQQSAQAVKAAQAAVRRAHEIVSACDDFKLKSKLEDNDDGDVSLADVVKDIFDQKLEDRFPDGVYLPIPGLPPIPIDIITSRILHRLKQIIDDKTNFSSNGNLDVELDTKIRCSGEHRRELEADVDVARALQMAAEQKYKLLTNPSTPEILYVVEPRKQAVVAANANLQKLKTGGELDQIALDLRVTLAKAKVDSLQALLAASPADFVQAQLRGALAKQQVARYRLQQAQQGQGGADVRPEDLVMAQADLDADRARLDQILHPMPELIVAARAAVAAADAQIYKAKMTRDGCSGPTTKTTTEIEGHELSEADFAYTSCSKDLERALDAEVRVRVAERQIAQVQLQMLTAPGPKLIRNLVEPAKARIAAAMARLQKLKTGGSSDQAELELNQALADAEVEFWQAALQAAPRGQIEAQLKAARAVAAEAEYRRQQAAQGLGGVRARPEDLVIAQSMITISQTELLEIVDPTQEQIWIAEAHVAAAANALDAARGYRDACDDPRQVIVKGDANGNGGNGNGGGNGNSNRAVLQANCAGGQKDALVAKVEVAQANLAAAEQQLKLLTNPTFPQIGYVIEPYTQAIAVATARLAKLKTGNNRDAMALETNAAVARAEVDRLAAVLDNAPFEQLKARLAGAAAELKEAEYRQQQAKQGLGGVGARPEDIAIAEALAGAAGAKLQTLMSPPVEIVRVAESNLAAAEAGVRVAKGMEDACGNKKATVTRKSGGHETGKRAVMHVHCSDDEDEVFDQGVKIASISRDIAAQQLKLLTSPGQPQILNVIAPLQQAVTIATAEVQKMKTGGLFDQASLELGVALARSDVERWQALANGDPVASTRAQLGGAQAAEATALARVKQAAGALGGARVRPEDLVQAQARLAAAEAKVKILTEPLQELVSIAKLSVSLAQAATAQARAAAAACGDLRVTTSFVESHNGNDHHSNGNSNGNKVELRTKMRCTDDQRGVLKAVADGLEGFQLTPLAALSVLTETCCNEKLKTLIAGARAEVDESTARLQKARTGGPDDSARLNLYAASATAIRQCRAAVVALAASGAPPPEIPPPFVWSDPDPCSLAQLPGKVPPFQLQDVRLE